MTDRTRILILGRGAMGSMFRRLLETRHEVDTWHRGMDQADPQSLESLASDRDLVIFALPAQPHERLARRLAPHVDSSTICLSIAKGVDEHARTPAEIFTDTLGADRHWALMYGPMIARDLSEGRSGFAVLAGNSPRAREKVELFSDTPLYLDTDDDLTGAAWSVVLKNVYVPLIGATDALEMGDNIRGFVIYEAVHELESVMTDLGGRSATARGPAGMGDLITSATSRSSHHRTIGADLAAGKSDKVAAGGDYIRSEGVHTARRVREHDIVRHGRYPLFDLACDFLTGPMDLEAALHEYFQRRFARMASS